MDPASSEIYLNSTQTQLIKEFSEQIITIFKQIIPVDPTFQLELDPLEFIEPQFINQIAPDQPISLLLQQQISRILLVAQQIQAQHEPWKATQLSSINHVIHPIIELVEKINVNFPSFTNNNLFGHLQHQTTGSEKSTSSAVEPTMDATTQTLGSQHQTTDPRKPHIASAESIVGSEEPANSSIENIDYNHSAFLMKLMQQALDPQQADQNFQLTPTIVNLIENKIGTQLFNYLISKYELNKNQFFLDDFRMLIIGVLANCGENWQQHEFIRSLLIISDLENSSENSSIKLLQELKSKINLDPKIITRITEQTVSNSIVSKGLYYFSKNVIPKLQHLMPIRFKANKFFKKDLLTVEKFSKINGWQNRSTPQLQQMAATEFNFNNLSNSNLAEGAIVPTLNSTGEIIFCKIKNFVNDKSIRGFVLVPIDPQQSLELKVIFKNSSNLKESCFDLEQNFPYRALKKNRDLIFKNLNSIVSQFNLDHQLTDHQRSNISLNIGGHGMGGTQAQLLMNELVTEKAYVIARQPTITQDKFQTKLLNNIVSQVGLEHQLDPHTRSSDPQKLAKYQQKTLSYINKHFADPTKKGKQFDEIIDPTTNYLRNIKQLKLSTVNAGGIPHKIRHNFIQAMKIIKDPNLSPDPINISCEKIITAQDLIQNNGAVDLAAYTTKDLMPTTTAMCDQNINTPYIDNLKATAIASTLLIGQFILGKTITHLAPGISSVYATVISLLHLNTQQQMTIIEDNTKELIKKIQNSHYQTHFNLAEKELGSKLIILENDPNKDPNEFGIFNQNLTNKIASKQSNKFIRKAKKGFYTTLRQIKNLYNQWSPDLQSQDFVLEDARSRGKEPIFTPLLKKTQEAQPDPIVQHSLSSTPTTSTLTSKPIEPPPPDRTV